MYSNNILNLQESTTILNACTKKVWKLIEGTSHIVIHKQTVSLYHNSWVRPDKQDASSWNWNPVYFMSVLPESHHLSRCWWRNFLRISFYTYVIGYRECSIHEKNYCVSAYVVAGKLPTRVLNPRGYVYIYIYIYISLYLFSNILMSYTIYIYIYIRVDH